MLEGNRGPVAPLLEEIAAAILLTLFSIPWILISAGMTLVGMLALSDQSRYGGLIVCLPAGLLLGAVIAWLGWYLLWFRPRRTVTAFKFDGHKLQFQTPLGWQATTKNDLTAVTPLHRRRQRWRIAAWSIEIRGLGWFILPISVDHSGELVALLNKPEVFKLDQIDLCASRPQKDRGLSI